MKNKLIELVRSVANDKPAEANKHFTSALYSKINDAFAARRIDLASSLINRTKAAEDIQ